ncbi:MAG: YggS family pyridoxal phosphate-dependent enzyme [Clostridiales bacterium]|nr:YggS family pyridoxal phosphate-dependent enzyme [Clostridiales bacterium]
MLEERIARIRQVLAQESQAWGKPPRLIAVTKYSPVEDILPLHALGVTDIGENRVQVIREKLPFLNEKFSVHLIGRLQTNKVKYIIKDVCLIHSLDSMSLAQEIDRQAQKAGRRMPVLVQVNIAREAQKAGIDEAAILPFIQQCAKLPGLDIKGLMAMMPLDAPRDTIETLFGRMRMHFDRCVQEAINQTDIRELSMGMSQDYDLAARAGATMVRVGSALFR